MTSPGLLANSPTRIFDAGALVRPVVHDLPRYEPATIPEDRPASHIKLDMNESPFGPSPKARDAIVSFEETNRYPDFAQAELREALAHYLEVPPSQVLAGAGLDDVLNDLMLLLIDDGDEVIISEPTFGVYRSLVALHGGELVDVPLTPGPNFALDPDAILAAVSPRTKLVIICNPNNPTGNLFDPDAVEQVIAHAPCLVVVDEAYAEFAGVTHLPLMARYPNLAVLRTMSKFAGLAGLRVGYGAFPDALMPYLMRVAPPFFNISALSVAAAIASLDDLPHLMAKVSDTVAAREHLASRLRLIPGVVPLPSSANFLLIRLPGEDAGPVVAKLASEGIYVRHFRNPSLGLRDCLRVSIGLPEELAVFAEMLSDTFSSGIVSP
ncbi:MAG: histidinol-phosphate transaminase [Chloroflexota bacterium]|nr:histidinol-phosphate transaminase [Chloroflexota bacterium]